MKNYVQHIPELVDYPDGLKAPKSEADKARTKNDALKVIDAFYHAPNADVFSENIERLFADFGLIGEGEKFEKDKGKWREAFELFRTLQNEPHFETCLFDIELHSTTTGYANVYFIYDRVIHDDPSTAYWRIAPGACSSGGSVDGGNGKTGAAQPIERMPTRNFYSSFEECVGKGQRYDVPFSDQQDCCYCINGEMVMLPASLSKAEVQKKVLDQLNARRRIQSNRAGFLSRVRALLKL